MKTSWIVLIGIGAAVLYGLVSHEVSGFWNFALAFEVGAVVALSLSGFRPRPTEEGKDAGLGQRSRSTAVSESDSDDQPVDATSSSRQSEEGASSVARGEDAPRIAPAAQLASLGGYASTKETNHQSTPNTYTFSAAPAADAAALWERARVMVHGVIPDPEEDAEYLDLVFSAAEGGVVSALAKLGEYAFWRGAFVEAYFWTKIAKRRLELEGEADQKGLKEVDDMLQNIRREWTAAGQPPEFENVYDSFPEERGELGRAFLRLDSGIEMKPTQEYIQALAEKGNPDAALFV